MNEAFPHRDELQNLLNALVEERITQEEMQRLEGLVLTDPEAEAYYVQFMSMHAELASQFDRFPSPAATTLRERAETPQPKATSAPVAAPLWFRRVWWTGVAFVATAAAILVIFSLVHKVPVIGPRPSNDVAEAIDHSVAVLVQAPGAKWEDTGLPTRPGAPLPAGTLRLKSGLALIEFYCGAMVILEGPVEFKLISRTEAYCASGKLRVRVPTQAQGFAIGSPKLYLVDRGTEFGLHVGDADKTEVHVFQGRVDLYDPDARKDVAKEVNQGKAVRLDAPGKFSPIDADPGKFSSARDVAKESKAETLHRQKAWLAALDTARKDKDLLVYYSFESEDPMDRTLYNLSPHQDEGHDGAIVGCTWTNGRWPGRQALEFKRLGDRVRFSVKGEYDSISLMAWVRVDALPNLNNALMMADGWPEGSLHWQIGDSATIILGVQTKPKKGAHYHAVGKMTADRFGQWVHLAVVYDKAAGHVLHYMDGQEVSKTPIQSDIPLRIGEAELGNWNVASHRNNHPVRNFCGCMDEFLMFARPLTAEEIGRFHELGRPPR